MERRMKKRRDKGREKREGTGAAGRKREKEREIVNDARTRDRTTIPQAHVPMIIISY